MWDVLSDWLLASYPGDLPMPVSEGRKCPMYPHSDGRWSWHLYNKFVKTRALSDLNVAILLKTLCVVDVDTHEMAAELEERFPVLATCPMEETRKGRHYFFERSSLCDSLEFMDQRSGVIPNVDFKTRCATGTAGVILVAPSEGKRWVRAPWTAGDVLPAIPEDLLRAVALPTRRRGDVTLVFPDGAELAYRGNAHLHRFGLLRILMEDEEDRHVTVPMGVGTARQFSDIMYFCHHRKFQRWPVDMEGARALADYLCATPKLMRWLDPVNPASPVAWLQSIDAASPGWGDACLGGSLVDITYGHAIRYQPIERDDKWLFHDHSRIDLERGATMLRQDMPAEILKLPGAVRDVLGRHPDLVLSGSAVLHMACSRALGSPSDYDLYYIGEGEAGLRAIIDDVKDFIKPSMMQRTGSAITLIAGDITLQVILRRYRDVAHVLTTFDLAPAQCALHAGRVLVTPNWLYSVRHMAAYVNFWHWNPSSVSRVFKYYGKGFEILVPALRRDIVRERVPCPGAHNLLAVEAAPREWALMLQFKRKRHGKYDRVKAPMLRQLVSRHHFWGDRRQSGYGEFKSSSMSYVLEAMVKAGMTWLGLRPVRSLVRSPARPDGPASMSIPEATDTPFRVSAPNFPQLYDFQRLAT